MDIASPAFWTALGSIVLTNILLSGDNAVVIAMAARALPPRQQRRAIVLGSLAAIVLRVALTLLAVRLLGLPWLKLAGALALLWIGTGLLLDADEAEQPGHAHTSLLGAVRTILVADLVMSLDNVLAVAAAAQGDTLLLVLGLLLSVPLIAFGSTLLLQVMERLPLLVTLGAALLGWLAGEMATSDPGLLARLGPLPHAAQLAAAACGALGVVALGHGLAWRAMRRPAGRD